MSTTVQPGKIMIDALFQMLAPAAIVRLVINCDNQANYPIVVKAHFLLAYTTGKEHHCFEHHICEMEWPDGGKTKLIGSLNASQKSKELALQAAVDWCQGHKGGLNLPEFDVPDEKVTICLAGDRRARIPDDDWLAEQLLGHLADEMLKYRRSDEWDPHRSRAIEDLLSASQK